MITGRERAGLQQPALFAGTHPAIISVHFWFSQSDLVV